MLYFPRLIGYISSARASESVMMSGSVLKLAKRDLVLSGFDSQMAYPIRVLIEYIGKLLEGFVPNSLLPLDVLDVLEPLVPLAKSIGSVLSELLIVKLIAFES